ncbi:MAG: hypothetical protein OXG51_09370 [Gammaproteobacteria bacterium]|nr:hypothetical protein [Gammaproteobacteria bacterium]
MVPAGKSIGCENEAARKGAFLAVAAALFCYLAADLAGLGLALDGLVYANVAKLLAAGEGGFWSLPHYIDDQPAFAEQPPLGIWLLSGWLFVVDGLPGGALWAEKAYSLTLAALWATVACHLYRALSGRRDYWLPIALLALMPAASYTLKNNFLENPLTLLTSIACLCGWRAPNSWRWTALTALAVLLAVGIKGPVGLFPLTAPWLFGWLAADQFRAGLKSSLAASALVAAGLSAVLLHPPAFLAAEAYWQNQIGPTFAGDRMPDHGRAYLLGHLGLNLAIAGLATLILGGWRNATWKTHRQQAGAVLAVALCAALPLLLSPRQYRHYLLPSLPLFAIGFSLLTVPRLPRLPYRTLLSRVACASPTIGRPFLKTSRTSSGPKHWQGWTWAGPSRSAQTPIGRKCSWPISFATTASTAPSRPRWYRT